MSETKEQRREATLMRRIMRNTSELLLNKLRLADRNGDGQLSPEEGAGFLSVSIVESDSSNSTKEPSPDAAKPSPPKMQTLPYIAPASTSSIIDDTVLLDRTKLKAMLGEAYDLKPEQVDALITKAYPKGVGEVTQGTLCTTTPELQCLPLPKGKIIKFSGPAKTS